MNAIDILGLLVPVTYFAMLGIERLWLASEFRGECGFEGDAPGRMGAMLAFADVNAPFYGEGSRGQKAPVSAS